MYICARCTKVVEATKRDPVVVTKHGKMHFTCMRDFNRDREQADLARTDKTPNAILLDEPNPNWSPTPDPPPIRAPLSDKASTDRMPWPADCECFRKLKGIQTTSFGPCEDKREHKTGCPVALRAKS